MLGNLTDWAQLVAYVAGSFAAVYGVVAGFREFSRSTSQRSEDLAWKRAKAAQELINGMCCDPAAQAGMRILEWPGLHIEWEGSPAKGKVTRSDMRAALAPKQQYSERDVLICDAIDSLLWHFAAMEHHIKTGLVEFDHLLFPAEYYIKELSADYDVVEMYLDEHGLTEAKGFMERFQDWTDAVLGDADPKATSNDMTTGEQIAPERVQRTLPP